ncbi:tRNA (guanosine(46)-N7)-methyltransferase TrmB [Thiothrix litoralis]|uniref:tRNA (guanine-N(7)-)-methyltransferase n=1 Tax=Thiothrix litoralis TaxID=2891210 RepID=A0ABX7WQX9_9GAMM|nr:tRNA (guanosine(46)-N7)-methyltransferase TrmB [Thiothrix litoralis]QTR45950.1 tRNA (guanosine(46)-N7)-methyltransferase TrmB [Thiothrix litoralis]
MESAEHPRTIKSFVLRQGRRTKAQEEALTNLWPVFGIETADTPLDFPSLFGRIAPVTLEIGFGNGDSLAQMARAAPERDFIGIEVHTPGVGHLLKLISEQGLQNLRLLNSDAVEILQKRIPLNSLERVQLFFPDPWHKSKHNKRRIVQAPFVSLLASRMQTGGVFHMATDWENYAVHMAEVMQTSPDFVNLAPEPPYAPRPDTRPLTKFENRGLKLGHGVWDLLYKKIT